jgi:hypothetical protein
MIGQIRQQTQHPHIRAQLPVNGEGSATLKVYATSRGDLRNERDDVSLANGQQLAVVGQRPGMPWLL